MTHNPTSSELNLSEDTFSIAIDALENLLVFVDDLLESIEDASTQRQSISGPEDDHELEQELSSDEYEDASENQLVDVENVPSKEDIIDLRQMWTVKNYSANLYDIPDDTVNAISEDVEDITGEVAGQSEHEDEDNVDEAENVADAIAEEDEDTADWEDDGELNIAQVAEGTGDREEDEDAEEIEFIRRLFLCMRDPNVLQRFSGSGGGSGDHSIFVINDELDA